MAKLVQGVGSLRKRIRDETQQVDDAPAITLADEAPTKKLKADGEAAVTRLDKKARKPRGAKGAGAKAKKGSDDDDVDSVVYLGHIPSGFFEAEIRNFFSQFGKVRRVKLFRSKKTGNSKGYAFVQFENTEIAQVAAEAMDGYMFGDRKLVAHVVEREKCHSGMFLPYKEKEVLEKKERTEESAEKTVAREYSKVMRSEKKKLNRIKASGLDF